MTYAQLVGFAMVCMLLGMIIALLFKKPGPMGLKGDRGNTGPPGLSAYDIARRNGFVGSEKEWLDSLNPPTTK